MNHLMTKNSLLWASLRGIRAVIVVLLLLLCSCSIIDVHETARPVSPKRRVIDTHLHLTFWTPNGKYSEEETQFFNSSVQDKAKIVQEQMDKAGVGMIFAMGRIGGPADDPLGITENLKISALVPGIKVIGAADPVKGMDEKHITAVRQQIIKNRSDIVAFKCYLGYMGGPEDPGYRPYYKLAEEFDLPVIFHTGDVWAEGGDVVLSNPLGVDRIAVNYPSVRFVMAHVGVPFHKEAAEVAWKNENVWVDLAGLLLGDEALVDEILEADFLPEAIPGLIISDLMNALTYMDNWERICYGSDWPLIKSQMSGYRRFIEFLIPEEHHQRVFQDNAEELFKINIDKTHSAVPVITRD